MTTLRRRQSPRREQTEAPVRSDQKCRLVGSGGRALPLTELHPKLPLSQPDAAELLGDGRREGPGGRLTCGAQLRRQGVDPRPGLGKSSGRSG